MLHELLDDCQEYKEETYLEVLKRYNGFGQEIYTKLKHELPQIFNNLKFYRATKSTEKCVGYFPQVENSYAIYDNNIISFGIQLNPESEVLAVFNFDVAFEADYWSENVYFVTMEFIKSNFVKK
jgi:hypothetical protein